MNEQQRQQLDEATSARLARLAGRPVDVTGLQAKLQRQMAQAEPLQPQRRLRLSSWQPWAVAAMLAIMLGVGWLFLGQSNSSAVAQPLALAKIYQQVTQQMSDHLKVSSVEEANRVLAEQADGSIPLPNMLPGQMHACCLRQYAGTMLTCALIEHDGKNITIALADGARLHAADGQTITRAGRTFMVHKVDGINMVMANQNGRWMCVMGDVPVDDLVSIAAKVKM